MLCSAPGDSLGTAKELSIKFDAKEDAEITQVDAVARERRSVPLMNFLVVLLAEDVFVDVSPAIIVTNAGDECDGTSLKRTTCVTAWTRSAFHSTW